MTRSGSNAPSPGGPRIVSVEAVPLAVAFRSTFRFGTTDRSTSPNVVVIVQVEDGTLGYGEACPVPAFTSETQASVVELVEQRVAPVLVGRDPPSREPLLHDLSKVLKFAPFTTAAVDTALLDLTGRLLGVPVSTLLGGAYRDQVEVHGSVGWDADPARMVAVAVEQAETYRSLKTYAGRGGVDADLDRLQAVRDAVGDDVTLFVDVNGLWSPSDLVRAMRRVRDIGLTMLEQPLPVHAARFTEGLVASGQIDVCADEGARSVADTARLVAERSATVVNLGHSKLGGPSAAMKAAQVASAAGLGLMVGGVIELGIANAMGLHLASALPSLAYPAYLMGPLKYKECITSDQVEVVDSRVEVPRGPGLGIEVDEDQLVRLDARLAR